MGVPRLKLIDLQSLHTLEVVIRGYPNRRHISWDTSALLSPQMLCSGGTVLAKSRMQHWEREKKLIEPAMNVPIWAAINLDLSSSVPTQCNRNFLFASVSQSYRNSVLCHKKLQCALSRLLSWDKGSPIYNVCRLISKVLEYFLWRTQRNLS